LERFYGKSDRTSDLANEGAAEGENRMFSTVAANPVGPVFEQQTNPTWRILVSYFSQREKQYVSTNAANPYIQ
jgi:hypothetical protein